MMAFLKLNDTKVESISFQNLDTTSTITGSSGFGELKYAKVSHKCSLLIKFTNAVYPHCLRDAGWILELTMTDYWDYILHFLFLGF